ncbi:MAG TPA: VOC family protein [Gaiellaceae bacterium]|nr:VOC family protein [Gaiellaceae bacterium]
MAVTARNLRWLGISVTDRPPAEAFLRDVLGMRVLFADDGSTELETSEGDRVQLFGPTSRYFGRGQRPIPLFEVDDARAAREELAGKGVEVGPLESDAAWEWFDVDGPEGLAIELGSRR